MEEMDNVGAEQCLVVHKVDVKGKIGVKHTTPQHVHCSGHIGTVGRYVDLLYAIC